MKTTVLQTLTCRFNHEFIEDHREQLMSMFDAKERDWLLSLVMKNLDVTDPMMGMVSKQAHDGRWRLRSTNARDWYIILVASKSRR